MGAVPPFLVWALGEHKGPTGCPLSSKQRQDHAVSPIAGAGADHPPRVFL